MDTTENELAALCTHAAFNTTATKAGSEKYFHGGQFTGILVLISGSQIDAPIYLLMVLKLDRIESAGPPHIIQQDKNTCRKASDLQTYLVLNDSRSFKTQWHRGTAPQSNSK